MHSEKTANYLPDCCQVAHAFNTFIIGVTENDDGSRLCIGSKNAVMSSHTQRTISRRQSIHPDSDQWLGSDDSGKAEVE